MNGVWANYHWEGDTSDSCLSDYGIAEHDRHATLGYDEVASAGPPARPLDFPSPEVFRGELVQLRARDHKSGTIHHLKSVLLRSNKSNNKYSRTRSVSSTAYLLTKKLSKTVYGSVHVCIVLKRIEKTSSNKDNNTEHRQDDESDCSSVEWESTDEKAAIKISEWKKIHSMRGKHLEDPIKEIAAMQLLGNYHRHIAGALEVLQDDKCLYTIMPYFDGGDLYERLIEFMGYRSVRSSPVCVKTGFDEDSARIWFRQLLQAVNLLQKKGVCHRDICLENILLDSDDNICLIDPGMSLRVPYTCSETGGIGDVSAGTSRRLMIAQGQGGKLMYAAPEIISNESIMDAFAIDLWSVGVVLFIMVVGLAPFRIAHPSDKRYANISFGGLKNVVDGLGISISPEICDLLQGFFWADPRNRLTLAEIIRHPWVQGKAITSRSSTLPSKSSSSYVGPNKVYSFGSLSTKSKVKGKALSPKKSHVHNQGNSPSTRSNSASHPNQHYLHLLQS